MTDDGVPRQVTSNYPAGLSDKFKFEETEPRARQQLDAVQERAAEEARADAARAEAARADADDRRARAEAAEAAALERALAEPSEADVPVRDVDRAALPEIEDGALPEPAELPDLPLPAPDLQALDDEVESLALDDAPPLDLGAPADTEASAVPEPEVPDLAFAAPEPLPAAPDVSAPTAAPELRQLADV